MIEFTDLPWAQKDLRGKEFGFRGNTYCYLQGRGPHVIHCHTGFRPEPLIRLTCGASIPGFGPRVVPVFSEDPNATEGLDLRNLFLSSDGTDQWPPQGYTAGGGLASKGVGRVNAALKPDTDYYWILPAIEGGHESWVPQLGIQYCSTGDDDLAEFAKPVIPAPIETLDITIQGVQGVWSPK